MAYAKWTIETPIFRCKRCGQGRSWGTVMLGPEDVETREALLGCAECQALTRHTFTGQIAEGNVEDDPCL